MAQRLEYFYPSVDGVNQIHALEWKPEGEPKAILQIVHGMIEYIERYEEFANYLVDHGFIVIANDHLGHGKSVSTNEDWGYITPSEPEVALLEDVHTLGHQKRAEHRSIPFILLGHSMGSFFAREYGARYGDELSALIIMGTGNQAKISLKLGELIVAISTLFKGDRYKSSFVSKLVNAPNLKRIKNPRTKNDWLSRNKENVDRYNAEPANNFLFTNNANKMLFKQIEYVVDSKNIASTPKDLPILLVSGAEDPVGEWGKAVKKVYEMYQKLGIKNLTMKLFNDDRHEILQEIDRQNVYEYILEWINRSV